MFRNGILVLNNNIIHTHDQSHRLGINKVGLIRPNNIDIMRIHAHSLECLHALYPKLRSAVEFENLSGTWNTNQIAVFGGGVILQHQCQIKYSDHGGREGIYLGVPIHTHPQMEISSGLDVVIGPVAVEFFGCYAFFAVVEELDVVHLLEVFGACLLVGEGATFCGCGWYGSVVCSRMGNTLCRRGQRKNGEEQACELHFETDDKSFCGDVFWLEEIFAVVQGKSLADSIYISRLHTRPGNMTLTTSSESRLCLCH